MQLPGPKGSGKSYYAGRRRKPDGEGFSRNSAVIAAQLSKGHSNLHIPSLNQYALLESEVSSSTRCNMNSSQLVPNKTILFTKPDYAKLAPWAKEHARMHQCYCKRNSCYWHHPGDQFNEREYEDQKEKPWVNQESPELPDAGEES